MNHAWANDEFIRRDREIAACRSYADYCRMKQLWKQRHKAHGLTVSEAKDAMREVIKFMMREAA